MNNKEKTLFVPDAPFRPGDKPDFSSLDLPEAGSSDKPDVLVNPSEIIYYRCPPYFFSSRLAARNRTS